jgi:hypothetical protein
MRSTRLIPLILCLLVMASLSVSAASAAPTNAPKVEILPLECDNGATYTIVVNGNGLFTPGHILDNDGRILIPVSFTFVGIDEAGNVLFTDTVSKPGKMKGVSGDLITCTFEVADEGLMIDGTVTVFVTPRS